MARGSVPRSARPPSDLDAAAASGRAGAGAAASRQSTGGNAARDRRRLSLRRGCDAHALAGVGAGNCALCGRFPRLSPAAVTAAIIRSLRIRSRKNDWLRIVTTLEQILPRPTTQFRRRAWLEFQRALDPLAPPKP